MWHFMTADQQPMKKTIHILFQSVIVTLIPLIFLFACQKKSAVELEKYNVSEVSRTDTVNLTNEEKIQPPKLYIQEDKNRNTIHNPSIEITKAKSINTSRIINCKPEPVLYPGGEQELSLFLDLNNSYKRNKYYESIEGIVYLKLLIDSTGKVIGSNIIRGVGVGINEEAIRLAELLKFLPAKDSTCNSISSDYILKVNFIKPYYVPVNIDTAYETDYTYTDKSFKDSWHLRKSANPHFIGGGIKMKRFFKKNLIYSDELKYECNEGKVKMILQINEHGRLLNITTYESTDPRLTIEAIRVIKSVTYWHPAITNHRHAPGYLKVTLKFTAPRKQRMPKNDKEN